MNRRLMSYESISNAWSVLAVLALVALAASPAQAIDEITIYDLLAPDSHKFAIRYDTATTTAGDAFFFNIIRPGSEASDEKVYVRATGAELPFEMVTGKEAKKAGQADKTEADNTRFIKVKLAHPVPNGGEYRLRILKTYKDAKSYYEDHGNIVFERSLGVKRNIIILPRGYEVIACSVPVMIDIFDDRVRISMVNDRDDELGVKIVGRKIPPAEVKP